MIAKSAFSSQRAYPARLLSFLAPVLLLLVAKVTCGGDSSSTVHHGHHVPETQNILYIPNCGEVVVAPTQLVSNGDFETPALAGSWRFYNPGNLSGWSAAQTEIGAGPIYNSRWTSQVIELDGDRLNLKYSQNFNLVVGQQYSFSLKCAAREGRPLTSSGFFVTINSVTAINQGTPANYSILSYSYKFIADQASTTIIIHGAGTPDSTGSTCDDISLKQVVSNTNSQLTPGGSCVCSYGFYADMNQCWSCSLIHPTCTSCRTASGVPECVTCTNGQQLVTGACNFCVDYLPGCLVCGTTCPADKCDTAKKWVYSNNACICPNTSYATNGECVSCRAVDPYCNKCAQIAGSFQCQICKVGSYLLGGVCYPCGLIHPACNECSSSSVCTKCAGAGANWVLQSNTCDCPTGFYVNSTIYECIACSGLNTQCQTCSGTSVSIFNDSLNTYSCHQCSVGYYTTTSLDGFCLLCTNSLIACTNCSMNGSICYTCDNSQNYFLQPVNQTTCTPCVLDQCLVCAALDNCTVCNVSNQYFLNTSSYLCTYCPVYNCVECADFYNCSICNESINYFLNITDNQCHLCQQEGCLLCTTLYQCTTCDIDSNYLLSNDTQTCYKCPLEGCSRCITNETCQICGPGYWTQPNENQTCTKLPPKCNGNVSDAVPLLQYNETDCNKLESITALSTTVAITSYTTMVFSLGGAKIVGLELFGVLQMAYLNLADQEFINLYLSPIANWKYMNGFNLGPQQVSDGSNGRTLQTANNVVPDSLRNIGYTHSFINNMNVMLIVLLAEFIIAIVLVLVSRAVLCLRGISQFLIKQIFLTLFIFNSFNIAFSAGIHFKYARPDNTENYYLSTAAAGLSLVLSAIAVVGLVYCEKTEFGEFKLKFKKNLVSEMYIPISIIYRMALGMYMGIYSEHRYGNLFILSVCLLFVIFNLVHLPFRDAYQNYRANLCHFTQLVILAVSNFYTTVKANDPLQVRASIFSPALLELYLLVLCVVVSVACLLYEIYLLIRKKCCQSNRKVADKEIEKSRMEFNSTEEDLSVEKNFK